MSDNGQRRRAGDNGNNSTHDLVIRIDENVKFIKLEAEEFKNLFEKHLEDDKINFKKVHDRIDPIKKSPGKERPKKKSLVKSKGGLVVFCFYFGFFFEINLIILKMFFKKIFKLL